MTFFHQLSIKETEANIQLAFSVMASRGMMAAGGNLTDVYDKNTAQIIICGLSWRSY